MKIALNILWVKMAIIALFFLYDSAIWGRELVGIFFLLWANNISLAAKRIDEKKGESNG